MIDTIAITMDYGEYIVKDHNKFRPSTKGLFEQFRSGSEVRYNNKYIQNPSKNDPYGPRLTIIPRRTRKGRLQIQLKIEFSVPKLLFGDNVNEVCEEDFDLVIERLQKRLEAMGVKAWTESLKGAAVSVAHFSKNIPLSGGYTAHSAISELEKLDVTGKLEISSKHFRNLGHALYFYCGSYHIIFYDKIKDLAIPKTKAVDKARTPGQLSLFEEYKKNQLPELLRMEARFTRRQKLKSMLKELGFEDNPTFESIFKKEVAQAVLQHYWSFIGTERYAFLLKTNNDDPKQVMEQLVRHYRANQKSVSASKALMLIGMSMYAKTHGTRQLKNDICTYNSKRTWDRLAPNLEILNKASKNSQPFGFVKDVTLTLNEFKPFRFAVIRC